MNLAEILIWQGANLLLLLPVVVGLVMLARKINGRAVFTERDWILLFGHPRTKALSLGLWARFCAMLAAVGFIGFHLGAFLRPWGSDWVLAGVGLMVVAIIVIAPRWLR